MKYAIALVALLAVTTTASANIYLQPTWEDLGDGLTQYTFYIRNDDGLMASYAATVAFETYYDSTFINQEDVMGNGPDDEPTADFLAGFGLDKERDTFSLSPFEATGSIPGNSMLNLDTFSGYREDTTYFEFSVGTGAGSAYGDMTPLAQVVTNGGILWIGTIARGTELFTVEGSIPWPEPTTMALLSLGVVAILKRRR